MIKAMYTNKNKCFLCPHNCVINEGKRGVCKVRINKNGEIYTLTFENLSSIAFDPIEKKPLYHFFPGTKILSIGTYGCNFHCQWCQNFEISTRVLNDDEKNNDYTKERIIELAKNEGINLIAYTYNEPTIFYEYMYHTAVEARKNGLKNVMVSNGYINEEPLRKLCKYLDAVNIDLKFFDEKTHIKYTGGHLKYVLNSLRILKEEGVWIEITFLMIPRINDDMKIFEEMCKWIKENLGKNTPLHISRFIPHYKLRDLSPTPIENLKKAKSIADKHLSYVYIGNTEEESNTYCLKCNALLIKRTGYKTDIKLIKGRCFNCKEKVSGIFIKE